MSLLDRAGHLPQVLPCACRLAAALCASSALRPAMDAHQCRPGFWLALAHGELNAEPLQEVRRSEESEVSVP